MDRKDIINASRSYFKDQLSKHKFIPGESYIPPTGKVLDEEDCASLIDASLDMWLTSGRFAKKFETDLAKRVGLRFSKLCTSGSSANLLAVSTLTSPKLRQRQLRPGDEIITVAAGFPTTVAPIVQNGCIPVFVDIDLYTYNADIAKIEKAINKRTKAIMLAHCLGNPFNLLEIRNLCDTHDLFLIEDCCDALGATVTMHDGTERNVGTFGDLSTLSFYPAHHITMGEGGAVLTNSMMFSRIAESFRDWGRDCHCEPGQDNTCGKRFNWHLGELPYGYDHKYTYTHLGYNLKVTDMQAAIGLSQLNKLEDFVAKRRANFIALKERLIAHKLEQYFILPSATKGTNPSWFGFMLTIKNGISLERNKITEELENKKIGTRLLFGGNLSKQPAFSNCNYKIIDNLSNTNKVMHDSFWLGIWPGLDDEHLDYMADSLKKIVQGMAKA